MGGPADLPAPRSPQRRTRGLASVKSRHRRHTCGASVAPGDSSPCHLSYRCGGILEASSPLSGAAGPEPADWGIRNAHFEFLLANLVLGRDKLREQNYL